MPALRVRSYGSSGPRVIVLHGGPGAPGYMAPVARGLEDSFRVLEPFQRGSGGEPLTVARHVADLEELLATRCAGERPALVGSSWGAMLALAFAAAHPGQAGPLVLIGCGTFDPAARARFQACLKEHGLDRDFPHDNEALRAEAELLLPLYACDPLTTDLELEPCDYGAFEQTWNDMLRLQEEGRYPAAFSAIETPVLMLHGTCDPHPGGLIYASLKPHLKQLEYKSFERCGHYPWLERAVREEFLSLLKAWLAAHIQGLFTRM